jgi:hypothetical protein
MRIRSWFVIAGIIFAGLVLVAEPLGIFVISAHAGPKDESGPRCPPAC